jgi:hypothetical protein
MSEGYQVEEDEDAFTVTRLSDGEVFRCELKNVTVEGVDTEDGTEILRVTDEDGKEWVPS